MGASSDPTVMKLANKAEEPSVARAMGEPYAAEPVERRAGTKGNAGQQSTCRTQSRECQSASKFDPRSASNFGSDAVLVQQIQSDAHRAPISLA